MENYLPLILGLLFYGTIITLIVVFIKRRTCPKCKRWLSGKLTNKSTGATTVSTKRHFDYGTKKYYRETTYDRMITVNRKCKKCGHVYSYTKHRGTARRH